MASHPWRFREPWHEVTARRDSILPLLNPETVAGLDAAEKHALETLVPCVCRGDVGTLRDCLTITNKKGEFESSNADGFIPHEPAAAADFTCPFSSLNLLQYAVLSHNAEIVSALLQHGADPEGRVVPKTNHPDPYHHPSRCPGTYTPLYMAVALGNVNATSLLVRAGANVTHSVWGLISRSSHSSIGTAMFEALLDEGRNSIPIQHAIRIVANKNLCHLLPLVQKPGSCKWHLACVINCTLDEILLRNCESRTLLRTQAHTAEEKLIKTLFIQSLVYRVIFWGSYDKPFGGVMDLQIPMAAGLELLEVLVNEGANPLGWSVRQFRVVMQAWKEIMITPDVYARVQYLSMSWEEWRDSCLADDFDFVASLGDDVPYYWNIDYESIGVSLWDRYCIEPSGYYTCGCLTGAVQNSSRNYIVDRSCALFSRNNAYVDLSPASMLPAVTRFWHSHMKEEGDDKLSRRLLQLANERAPCAIKSVEQIPYSHGLLHNGPRCSRGALSEEQKRVSLRMCSYSGSHVPSLTARCRDAILCFLPGANFLNSVRALPAPEVMKSYIITGGGLL